MYLGIITLGLLIIGYFYYLVIKPFMLLIKLRNKVGSFKHAAHLSHLFWIYDKQLGALYTHENKINDSERFLIDNEYLIKDYVRVELEEHEKYDPIQPVILRVSETAKTFIRSMT